MYSLSRDRLDGMDGHLTVLSIKGFLSVAPSSINLPGGNRNCAIRNNPHSCHDRNLTNATANGPPTNPESNNVWNDA